MSEKKASASTGIVVRRGTPADAEACGRICYEGFKAINERHGFPATFPDTDVATGRVRAFLEHADVFGVVAADRDGRILGFNFLSERDPVRAIGPIVVDPTAQGRGVGRQLMAAVLDRAADALSVRLVQDAFNLRSLALYAELGFEAREPLVVMTGRPERGAPAGWEVRPLRHADLDSCAALHERVHGYSRRNELHEALARDLAWVALRDGRVVAYAAAMTLWLANHGVGETEDDLAALLAGAGCRLADPIGLLLPIRQAGLFRWCLEVGLRPVRPMTLMSRGAYRKPRGAWFASVLY